MKRWLVILAFAAACGPKHTDPPPDDDDLPDLTGKPVCESNSPERWTADVTPPDGDTEIARRQQAACNQVMPVLTACAVSDACEKMEPDKLAELDLENTAPIHARENLKKCKGTPMSSHQVRVYEVCIREEQGDCAALAACLENANPPAE